MNTSSSFFALMALALIGTSACRVLLAPDTAAVAAASTFNDERIVGGSTVDISAYPHQVSMRYKNIFRPENSYTHNCGGSIYSKDIIITAAHCVIGKVASEYQIVAGTNQRRSADGVITTVKEIIMNQDYAPSTYNNDIAIVVLGSPLPINNFTIKPVQLAEEYSRDGATATISGWGTLVSGGSSPTMLQAVQVPIVRNELCNADYSGQITDAMLCAGVRGVGGKDACQGDSGGPLLVNGKLAGVVSWGYGCADSRYPGVYSNVTHLLPWLRENIALVEAKLSAEN